MRFARRVVIDLTFAILFLIAFLKTQPVSEPEPPKSRTV